MYCSPCPIEGAANWTSCRLTDTYQCSTSNTLPQALVDSAEGSFSAALSWKHPAAVLASHSFSCTVRLNSIWINVHLQSPEKGSMFFFFSFVVPIYGKESCLKIRMCFENGRISSLPSSFQKQLHKCYQCSADELWQGSREGKQDLALWIKKPGWWTLNPQLQTSLSSYHKFIKVF